MGYTEDPDYEMCLKKMLNVLERENATFDYVYDWTTRLDINERKKHNNDNKKKFKRKNKRNHTLNKRVSGIDDDDNNIKINIKEIDDEDEDQEVSGSDHSNKAEIDKFDIPANKSTNEDSQCCTM